MPRYIRNTAILAKKGVAPYGTDSVPTGGANAMLVSNVSINPLNATNVARDNIRAHFGASEQLVGDAYVELGFDVELAGSGTAGTAPAWGPLLEACAFAMTDEASYVEYLPVTNSQGWCDIYYFDDGVVHKVIGARGNATIKLNQGDRPVISYSFFGLDGGIAADALPAQTLTAFQKPLVVTSQNSGDITLGATYLAGAVSGGTAYPSQGIEINAGQVVAHNPILGAESVDVTNRSTTASLRLELTAAQEVTLMGEVKANALRALSFQHGTTAGNIVLVHAPSVQFLNPSKEDMNGRRLIGFDATLLPTAAGNDELRVVVK